MPIFMKNGQNGKPELSLEAFFEIPIYGICVYFTIFCEMYPNFEMP